DHQSERHGKRSQEDTAAQHQTGICIKRKGQNYPCQTECLHQSQDQHVAVVHDNEIIQIKKVKRCQAYKHGQGGIKVAVLLHEFVSSSVHTNAQIDYSQDHAEHQCSFGQKQQHSSPI